MAIFVAGDQSVVSWVQAHRCDLMALRKLVLSYHIQVHSKIELCHQTCPSVESINHLLALVAEHHVTASLALLLLVFHNTALLSEAIRE